MPPDDPNHVDPTPADLEKDGLTALYRRAREAAKGWFPASEFAQAYLERAANAKVPVHSTDRARLKDWADRMDSFQRERSPALYEPQDTRSVDTRAREQAYAEAKWYEKPFLSGPAMVVGTAAKHFTESYVPGAKVGLRAITGLLSDQDYDANSAYIEQQAQDYAPVAADIAAAAGSTIGMMRNPLVRGAGRALGGAPGAVMGRGERALRGAAGLGLGGGLSQGITEAVEGLAGPPEPEGGSTPAGRIGSAAANLGLAGALSGALAPTKHAIQAALTANLGKIHPAAARGVASFLANVAEGGALGALPHVDETGAHLAALEGVLEGGPSARQAWGGLLVSGLLQGALGTTTKVDPAVFQARARAKLLADGIPEAQHPAVISGVMEVARTLDQNLGMPAFDATFQRFRDTYQKAKESYAANPVSKAPPAEPDRPALPAGPDPNTLVPDAPFQAPETPGEFGAFRRSARPVGWVPGGAERPGEFAAPLEIGRRLRWSASGTGPTDAPLPRPGTAEFDTALTEPGTSGESPILGVYTRKSDGVKMEVVDTPRGVSERPAPAASRDTQPPKPAPGRAPPATKIAEGAAAYHRAKGLPPPVEVPPQKVDPARGKRIADAYEALPASDYDTNPATRKAYDAFKAETREQFEYLTKPESEGGMGVKVEWYGKGTGFDESPYKSSADMIRDLRENHHVWVFRGGNDHPVLDQPSGVADLSHNDLFRAVHEAFGHAQRGNSFGPNGEETAWLAHGQMYSPDARRAMTTETRGQNSWFNFSGKNTPESQKTNPVYAVQKAALLPDEFTGVKAPAKPTTKREVPQAKRYLEDLPEIERAGVVSKFRAEVDALQSAKYPMDATFDGEPVQVLGPPDRFEPYKSQATGQRDEFLMVQRPDGSKFITTGKQLLVNGKPLVSSTPPRKPGGGLAAALARSAEPKKSPTLEELLKRDEEPTDDELDALVAAETGQPMERRPASDVRTFDEWLKARPHDQDARAVLEKPGLAARPTPAEKISAPLSLTESPRPGPGPMDRAASVAGEKADAVREALGKAFVDENEIRVSPIAEIADALRPVYGDQAENQARRIRDALEAPKGREADEAGPTAEDIAALERGDELPDLLSVKSEDGTPVRKGDAVEVKTADGSTVTGQVAGETGARVKVGGVSVRKSDLKSAKVVRDEARDALQKAAASGDEAALEKATEAFLRDRALEAIESVNEPDRIDRQVQAPLEISARDFAEGLGEASKAPFWEVQKAETIGGRSYPRLVASEGGTWEVRPDPKAGTVRLVPVVDPKKIKPTGTTLGTTALPPGLAGGLYGLAEGGARKLWNPVADTLTKILGYPIYGEKMPWGDYLKKNLTEIGRHPEISRLDNERQGTLRADLEKHVTPILELAKALPKEQFRAVALALNNGGTVKGHEALIERMRGLARFAADRLVEEGAMDPMVRKTHSDPDTGESRYFPWVSWKQHKGPKGDTVRPAPDVVGPTTGSLLDARDVRRAGKNLRARDSYRTIEEAEKHGLDLTTNPVGDFVEVLALELRAAESLRYFRRVAEEGLKHPERLVLPPSEVKGGEAPLGYTAVPDQAVNSYGRGEGRIAPNGKTFGALAGHAVHDSVWSQLETMIEHRGEIGATFDLFHTMGRKAKTVFRLGGHLVQRMGNPLIWAADGVPYSKLFTVRKWGKAADRDRVDLLPKGLTVLVDGKEVAPTRDALLRAGVLQADPAASSEATSGPYRGLGKGGPSDVVAAFGNRVEKMVPFAKRLESGYGHSDEVSRAGLYLYHRSTGATHKEALDHVLRWYDMRNVPRGIRGAARWISFFRFQYKMMQNTQAILRETPFTFLKVGLAVAAMQKAQQAILGMDSEEYDEALRAAVPGSGLVPSLKRTFTLPWFSSGGRPGFWSFWNLLPHQSVVQGLMPTPAGEKAGGGATAYGQKVLTYLAGGANTVFKPISEAAFSTDVWSGGNLQRKLGITGEEPQSEKMGQYLRHFGRAWAPDVIGSGVAVLDSAGLWPAVLGTERRPDASGNFPTFFDKATEFLGVPIRHPDPVNAKIVAKREELEDNPDLFLDPDGHFQVRHGLPRDRQKAARRAINTYSGGSGSLAEARAHRALAWLRDGNVEKAAREVGSDRSRFDAMADALSPEEGRELRQLAQHHGILPARRR